MSDRTRNLLRATRPGASIVILDDLASRPEDVEAFVERWVLLNGLTGDHAAVQECVKFCCASGLPRGYRTVESFLAALAGAGWSFSGALPAADAASAFREATAPLPALPTLLVEGYTDRVYLEWLLQGLQLASFVEVRDCDGAKKVAEQAIALRNQGHSCLAVVDSDAIGKQVRKQLADYGHPVLSVPIGAVNLPKSAFDHVQQVAEIEDLLPVAVIEEFLSGNQRRPELEIRASTGVRYVICDQDKGDLARWVVEETEREAVPTLTAFLRAALDLLGVSASGPV